MTVCTVLLRLLKFSTIIVFVLCLFTALLPFFSPLSTLYPYSLCSPYRVSTTQKLFNPDEMNIDVTKKLLQPTFDDMKEMVSKLAGILVKGQ